MRTLVVLFAGAVLAASWPSTAAAAICEVFRRPIAFAVDSEVQIIVLSGRDCRVRFYDDEVFAVETIELTERPLHGGARVQPLATVYYRSNPGYRGNDRFAFKLCGAESGRRGCSNVFVRIRVR